MILSACAATQTGIQSGGQSKFQAIAVVPRVNDTLLTVYRQNAFSTPVVSEAQMGWNAAKGAGQISTELLSRAGASVSVTADPIDASAKASEAVIVLQQTPLDQFAQKYVPGQDLMLSVASIAGAAAAGGIFYIIIDDEKRYRPRSILEIKGSEGDGPSYCAIGITPSLINASSGETIRRGRSLMGVEKLPAKISGQAWRQFTPTERSTVLAYCQSALRRVISQSFVELKIVK
jgi:hypothetical protein